MSISPTDAQRYVSNPSSRDSEQNPSSGHGLFPSQHDGCPFGRRTNESASISAGSAQDSSTGPPDGRPFETSRPNHGSFEDTTGASKNVRELKSSNARKHSSGKNSSTYPRHQSFGQSSSSQFRSNKLDMQPNGRLAATVNMLHSDHWPLDSSDIQFTTTQASRRRDFLNANHLLNFHYDSIPRPRQPQRTHLPRRQQRVKPYNKDLFLQANYKFIIYDSGSYSLESIDPDKMFPWEDVVCVRYSSPFPAQCPICLESPLCPQITSCGHIFCFPCILRYLLMGVEDHKGESWKKCPLCFSMISSKDLYTIKIDDVKQFRVGDHVDFLLLARAKDSQIPLLKSQGDAGVMPTTYDNASDLFSKFILSSDVELSVRDAKIGLTDWLCKAETGTVDDLEKLPYVCAALEELEERMRKWTEDRIFNDNSPQFNRFALSSSRKVRHHHPNSSNPCPLNSNLETEHAHSKAWMVKSLENGQIHEMSEFSEKASDGSHPKTTVGSSEFLHDEVLQKDSNSFMKFRERDSYTFYQAIDGQALILHPLCMKCLLHHYGSYDMLPPRISGVILELEIITQSEAMRKRYRYLSHFSLSTTFQLCEIDLAEILPFASLAPFMGEIKKREKQRKKLAKKERDEKIRVEAANCAEVASLREMLNPTNQRYLSDKDTIFSLDEFEALGSGVAPTTNPSMNTTTTKLFSNVTRLGYAAAYDSPALRAVDLANSSGIMDATQEASGSHGPSTAAIPSSYASILTSSTKSESEGGPEMHNSNGNGITRKGKKPNRVLLSTAGGRRY